MFQRSMSGWDEDTPVWGWVPTEDTAVWGWGPTHTEIESWEPAGVSRGRGFAPAGRGRGIAKWSSKGRYQGKKST